ncbi:MAG TPA: phosphoribosyltransferase family protein [Mycobacteriales bacterium]|nr:phosphoribosyltransferase family protein [Mycobacteriales bacterium]
MALLDLLCPTRCESCGKPGSLVCARCRSPLAGAPYPHRPTPCPPGMPPLWVVAAYEGPVRELLIGFKERGAVGLLDALARPLAAAVRAAAPDGGAPVLLVPVPSMPAAVRRRGDDVIGLLARRTSRCLRRGGVDARAVAALSHRRTVADSAGLSATQRAANLREALLVSPRVAAMLRPYRVVVVDDLVTTGTTLTEATRTLSSGQVNVVGAAVIAATRRRS